MDTRFINLKFESNDKTVEVGKGKPYRLLFIDGIESGEYELSISDNVLADGSKVNNRRIKSRSIVIEAEYVGSDSKDERDRITRFFNIHQGGILTIDLNGITRTIPYEIEGFKSKLDNLYIPLRFLVQLYCPDPFLKDISENKKQIALWRGDFHFPLIIPQTTGITMGHREPSLIANIENKGHVKTGMKIEFKARGTLKNPSLFNVNTREFIKINKGMVAGEKIIINTNQGNKKIVSVLNGVTTNILNYIDIKGGGNTFLQLDPGDNLFRYDADENLDNLEVNIYYNNNYLGV